MTFAVERIPEYESTAEVKHALNWTLVLQGTFRAKVGKISVLFRVNFYWGSSIRVGQVTDFLIPQNTANAKCMFKCKMQDADPDGRLLLTMCYDVLMVCLLCITVRSVHSQLLAQIRRTWLKG